MRNALLLLLGALSLQAANTIVTDTVYSGIGAEFARGRLIITPNSQFTCADGREIYPVASNPIILNKGVFSVSLCPNTTASPANTSYTAQFQLERGLIVSWQETWVVTTLTPSHLPDVRVSTPPIPIFTLNLSQLRPISPNNYCVTSNGTVWGAALCGGGSSAFNLLTSGTNTTAAMVVGNGASLSFSGSGFINANRILGVTLTTLTGVIAMTAGVPTVVGGSPGDCVLVNGTSSPCGSGTSIGFGFAETSTTIRTFGTLCSAVITNTACNVKYKDQVRVTVASFTATITAGTGGGHVYVYQTSNGTNHCDYDGTAVAITGSGCTANPAGSPVIPLGSFPLYSCTTNTSAQFITGGCTDLVALMSTGPLITCGGTNSCVETATGIQIVGAGGGATITGTAGVLIQSDGAGNGVAVSGNKTIPGDVTMGVNGRIKCGENAGFGGCIYTDGSNQSNFLATNNGTDTTTRFGPGAGGVILWNTGGVQLGTGAGEPTCTNGSHVPSGTLWYTPGGAGVKDKVDVCTKDAANNWAWRVLY